MKTILIIITICFFSSCAKNVWFGDSITNGYGVPADSSFVKIIGHGVNYAINGTSLCIGQNSMLTRLNEIPVYHHQKRLYFGFGANDATEHNGSLDTDLFKVSYSVVIYEAIQKYKWPAKKITIFMPHIKIGHGLELNRIDAEIALLTGVRYVNLWDAIAETQSDGVHQNELGNKLIAKKLK